MLRIILAGLLPLRVTGATVVNTAGLRKTQSTEEKDGMELFEAIRKKAGRRREGGQGMTP
jgi:hypothetical protein